MTYDEAVKKAAAELAAFSFSRESNVGIGYAILALAAAIRDLALDQKLISWGKSRPQTPGFGDNT